MSTIIADRTLAPYPLPQIRLPVDALAEGRDARNEVSVHHLPLDEFTRAVSDLQAAGVAVEVTEWDGSAGRPVAKIDVPVGPFYLSAGYVDQGVHVHLYSDRYPTRRGPLGRSDA